MTLTKISNGQVAPGSAEEQNLAIGAESQKVKVKAHPANAGVVWIGGKGKGNVANGYPLSAGQEIELDLKGTGLSFTCANAADKISWISLSA
jgi:hypothetical protein